jgi:hypothetical protein
MNIEIATKLVNTLAAGVSWNESLRNNGTVLPTGFLTVALANNPGGYEIFLNQNNTKPFSQTEINIIVHDILDHLYATGIAYFNTTGNSITFVKDETSLSGKIDRMANEIEIKSHAVRARELSRNRARISQNPTAMFRPLSSGSYTARLERHLADQRSYNAEANRQNNPPSLPSNVAPAAAAQNSVKQQVANRTLRN